MSIPKIANIETPALLLDRQKMERNIARMRSQLAPFDVLFRPHVKTNKSIDVASALFSGTVGAITVSTLKEAECFAQHGFNDILCAVGIAPSKLDRVIALMDSGVKVTIVLDNLLAAQAVCAKSLASKVQFNVMIEIDSDGHRAGVAATSLELLEIGTALFNGGQNVAGVMTHAGSSYNCRSIPEIKEVANRERDAVVLAATRLRQIGIACPAVSVGSTPTAMFIDNLDGVTEVRAGVFVFFDLVMAGLEVCSLDDLALSVLTTVIGHQRDTGRIIVDAGCMAMSRDQGTASQATDQRYGIVCDERGHILADLLLMDANQEHGLIGHRSGEKNRLPDLPVGTLLRILPNHACATAAQHDRYHVTQSGDDHVLAVWHRFGGWSS